MNRISGAWCQDYGPSSVFETADGSDVGKQPSSVCTARGKAKREQTTPVTKMWKKNSHAAWKGNRSDLFVGPGNKGEEYER